MADGVRKTTMMSASRTKAIAFVGLSVALMAVSSWVVIPIGPIPLTLQMFVIPLLICVLPAQWSTAAVFAFIVLGGLGVPLFSGFRGGLGTLMGPTGGFLLGYLIAVPAAAFFLQFVRKWVEGKAALLACEFAAGMIFTVIAYMTGWAQYAAVSGVGMDAAFMVAVAPFIVPDIVKVLVAVACAQPLRVAINQ